MVTKRRDIIQVIAKAAKAQGLDWSLVREGGSHTMFSLDGLMIPIPRHNEVNEITSRGIYKECAEKLGKDWWRT